MSAIAERFATLKSQRRAALIPYLMSGFPDRAKFRHLLGLALDEQADLIEIGLPFSDPLADGPVIQNAGQVALEAGIDLKTTLEDVAAVRGQRPEVPLLLMSYLNPLRAVGLETVAERCSDNGVTGWIIPDRDLDDAGDILAAAATRDVDVVPLLAPTTPETRVEKVLEGAGGFVYLVSVTGVTGARRDLELQIDAYAGMVRRHTSLPLCVGFGISSRVQAEQAARFTDGVIVGSALLEPFLSQPFDKAEASFVERLRDIRSGLGGGGTV